MTAKMPDNLADIGAIKTICQLYQDKAIVLINTAGQITKLQYNDKYSTN